jgi:hypothetical protein
MIKDFKFSNRSKGGGEECGSQMAGAGMIGAMKHL